MNGGVLNEQCVYQRALYTTGQQPQVVPPVLYCRLFVNDVDPTCLDTPETYTECTLAGYTFPGVGLVPANWQITSSLCAYTCTYPPITWTFTAGGQTIYGHFVWEQTTDVVWWSSLWLTPYEVPDVGGSVTLTLQWTDMQCPSDNGSETRRNPVVSSPRLR